MRLTRREFAAGIAAGIAAPHVVTSANAQGAAADGTQAADTETK